MFESGGLDLSKVAVGPDATVNFSDARFENGCLDLRTTAIEGRCYLCRATLNGTEFKLEEADLRGSIDFRDARLVDGLMRFAGARVESGRFRFGGARFEGTTLDFSEARIDGAFDFGTATPATPPPGVILPSAVMQEADTEMIDS